MTASRRSALRIAAGAVAVVALPALARTKTLYTGHYLLHPTGTSVKDDLEAMEIFAHWVLERGGCDPATIKFAYAETHNSETGEPHKHGTFYVWEGQAQA